jgi:hypothetical protein
MVSQLPAPVTAFTMAGETPGERSFTGPGAVRNAATRSGDAGSAGWPEATQNWGKPAQSRTDGLGDVRTVHTLACGNSS